MRKLSEAAKISKHLNAKYALDPVDLHNLQSLEKAVDGLRINNRILRRKLAESVLQARALRRQVQGAEREVSIVSESFAQALADKMDVLGKLRKLKESTPQC